MTKTSFIAGAMLIYLISPSEMRSSTNCEQTFKLLGLNWRASKVLWIGEDLSGECHSSRILQVILSDSGNTTINTHLKTLHDWEWLTHGLQTEVPMVFTHHDDSWVSPDVDLEIQGPRADSTLLRSFQQHILSGGSNGYTWNRDHRLSGITKPEIKGVQMELRYYYPYGLYVGYTISDVYFFPEGGLLLVFTNHRTRAVGNDTMHGFLIFKTNPK
jgi:hypothetical protein